MSLEDIVKKTVRTPVRAARSLYESVIRPAAGYVKNVVLGYLPHTVRTMIERFNPTSWLIPDRQKTFYRNLQFDVIKDFVGMALGASLLISGLYIPGVVLAGASLIDLAQNGLRYVINKASNGRLRPAPLWTEISSPWIYLSVGHAGYHVVKYGAVSPQASGS